VLFRRGKLHAGESGEMLLSKSQPDSASSHFHADVQELIIYRSTGCWICQGEPAAWPSLSPDFTSMHSRRGFVKNNIFNPPLPRTIKDLKEEIIMVGKNIMPNMLIV
jgi:hypothetical protein